MVVHCGSPSRKSGCCRTAIPLLLSQLHFLCLFPVSGEALSTTPLPRQLSIVVLPVGGKAVSLPNRWSIVVLLVGGEAVALPKWLSIMVLAVGSEFVSLPKLLTIMVL
jgi:hypothetical protein